MYQVSQRSNNRYQSKRVKDCGCSVVEMLKQRGLRDQVKVIVGGATVTEDFARETGVDGYAKTALAGANICKAWIESSPEG